MAKERGPKRNQNPHAWGRQGGPQADARRRLRLLTLGTLAVVAIAVVLAVAATRDGGDGTEDLAVFELHRQPVLGAPEAPVTVVEFADFKCPYCREFALDVFPRLKQEYIDTGKVRFYFINYPFIGSDSTTAALALEAVHAQSPEGVWDFIDAVMRNQGDEQQEWATPQLLVQLAREAVPDIDAQQLASDLEARRYQEEVNADLAIVERLGVRGTPSVYVNGKFVDNWSYEGVKAAIDQALQDTQAAAATGGGDGQ